MAPAFSRARAASSTRAMTSGAMPSTLPESTSPESSATMPMRSPATPPPNPSTRVGAGWGIDVESRWS